MTQTVDRFNEYCKEYDSLKENQLYYRKEIQELIQLLNENLQVIMEKQLKLNHYVNILKLKMKNGEMH